MNAKRKEKAVKDYKGFAGLTDEELIEKLKGAEYTEVEIPEIIEAIKNGAQPETKKVVKFNLQDLSPDSKLDDDDEQVLSQSKEWKQYKELESAKPGNAMIDYIVVNASPVIKKKQNGDILLIGLNMEREKPLKTTRITVRNARLMNDQIYNTNTHPAGRFYYLIAEHFNY